MAKGSNRSVLSELVGAELSAVTFVKDYVQLHFDGPFINAITLPQLTISGEVVTSRDAGFRDVLCARIGSQVADVDVANDEKIQLTFADGVVLEISLRSQDRIGAESALYENPITGAFDVW